MGHCDNLHNISSVVAAFLNNSLKRLKRICSLKIMERADENSTVFMGHIADSL